MDRNKIAEIVNRVIDELGVVDQFGVEAAQDVPDEMAIWENKVLGIEDEPRGPLYTAHGEIFSPKDVPGMGSQRPYMQVDEFGMPSEDLAMVELGLA